MGCEAVETALKSYDESPIQSGFGRYQEERFLLECTVFSAICAKGWITVWSLFVGFGRGPLVPMKCLLNATGYKDI